ncbi:MAG: CotH kinase family protein, partial [Prevotella sp.]|nr:CotH kinase family protein [Prevotella sp.]
MRHLHALAMSATLMAGFALTIAAQNTSTSNYPLSNSELSAKIAAHAQLTDVPTIYIDIPGITTENELSSQLYKDRSTNYAPYLTATITVVDNSAEGSPGHLENFTDQVQIKVRGNSTSNSYIKKLPYRLKFASKSTAPNGVAHKHDLLGYGYSKRNWTLLANAGDKSMLRNAVTYHLGRYVGMQFCPGYKFVDLVISGMYRGTYQVSDHPEVGTDRVEIDEATGWLMEHVSWTNMAEEPYIPGYPETVCIKSPDADDLTEEELTQLKSDMSSYLTTWRNGFTSGNWRSYNDVVSFINYYIATEITGDWDAYFVFKTAKEANSDKMLWPMLWDKDLAYGNWTDNTQLVEYFNNNANFAKYFTDNGGLLENKWFLKLAKEKIDALIEDGLADKLCADIDRIAASIESTRLQNYAKYTYALTSPSVGERYLFPEYETHVSTLKEWIRARIPTVQSELQIRIDAVGGVDDLEEGEGGETVTEGLTYLGQGVKWNSGEYVYTYQGSKNTMLEGAEMAIKMDGTASYYGLYVDTQPYTEWKGKWDSTQSVTITLSAADVATLKENGYKFTLITYNSTVSSVTLTGGIGGGGGDEPVLRGQLTDVPTIYIDTEGGAAINSTDAYTPASIQVFDDNGTLSEFTEEMGIDSYARKHTLEEMQKFISEGEATGIQEIVNSKSVNSQSDGWYT